MKTEYWDALIVVLSFVLLISLMFDSSGLLPLLLTSSIIVCMLAKINARRRYKSRCSCRDRYHERLLSQEERDIEKTIKSLSK